MQMQNLLWILSGENVVIVALPMLLAAYDTTQHLLTQALRIRMAYGMQSTH